MYFDVCWVRTKTDWPILHHFEVYSQTMQTGLEQFRRLGNLIAKQGNAEVLIMATKVCILTFVNNLFFMLCGILAV